MTTDRNGSNEELPGEEAERIKNPINSKSTPDTMPERAGDKFTPHDLLSTAFTLPSGLPSEIWTIVQSAPANFPPNYFLDVSRNLLENPNLTASHLARAELSYQSFADATFNPKATTSHDLAGIIKHLRPECQPLLVDGGVDGYELEWTVVRKLIPRNPKLDDSLMQTCHLFTSHENITISTLDGEEATLKTERYLVIYIPHAKSPDDIPFYHPKVRRLGILYTYFPSYDPTTSSSSIAIPSAGTISIYYDLFPTQPLDNRLSRTALKLLEIIHKHSRGRQAGYKKRVHHDQIIPQKRFQDTYAYLKGKYAKPLIESWVEQTPPEKHVFEDLGIAAFLIELWNDMYTDKTPTTQEEENDPPSQPISKAQSSFPGFVDIGCGNGLLVYILNTEGWRGWGFDARTRKTWSTFPPHIQENLKEMLLNPAVLFPDDNNTSLMDTSLSSSSSSSSSSHNGIFPPKTFIISNHADELTPWTPILASLSHSPFIAIPCCSHDFGGSRFRSPVHRKYVLEDPNATGKEKNKQPSAYASLCSWVSHLTELVGYRVEKEHLRIPSTRNIAVVGRQVEEEGKVAQEKGLEDRLQFARQLIEKEMGGATTIEQIRLMWMKSGGELVKPGKGGH